MLQPDAYNMPFTFEPGSSWAYSPGPDWVAEMIKRATGGKLGDFFAKHIFTPLGMSSTTFDLPAHPDIQARQMKSCTRDQATRALVPDDFWWNRDVSQPDGYGGAGLYSTTGDFIRLLTALMRNDGTLLKQDTVPQMFLSQIKPESSAALSFLMGVDMFRGLFAMGLDTGLSWSYGFGGILVNEECPGKLSKGSLTWCGLTNTIWISTDVLSKASNS